jgi:hypothetical protein
VDAFGVVEDPFRQCRLAGVDVGADPDVPDLLDVVFHVFFPAVRVLLLSYGKENSPHLMVAIKRGSHRTKY